MRVRHSGIDIDVPNFRWMDGGVSTVLAAASGVVTTVHDNEPDRNTSCTGNANLVRITRPVPISYEATRPRRPAVPGASAHTRPTGTRGAVRASRRRAWAHQADRPRTTCRGGTAS